MQGQRDGDIQEKLTGPDRYEERVHRHSIGSQDLSYHHDGPMSKSTWYSRRAGNVQFPSISNMR